MWRKRSEESILCLKDAAFSHEEGPQIFRKMCHDLLCIQRRVSGQNRNILGSGIFLPDSCGWTGHFSHLSVCLSLASFLSGALMFY